MKKAIIISKNDNVGVSLQFISKGTELDLNGIKINILSDIPRGHKFALEKINEGQDIIKYGYSIGLAKTTIPKGEHVHINNLKTRLSENREFSWNKEEATKQSEVWEKKKAVKERTIQAYKRKNGKIAVRNEIWIIPTVGCINGVVEKLKELSMPLIENSSIDGIQAWTHPYGCSQTGEDHARTRKLLADLVHHPHAGGVLVVGLGCENNTMEEFKTEIGDVDLKRTKFLVCQEVDDEIKTGMEYLNQLIDMAEKDKREKVSIDNLIIGMKCGGSDGLSGITANPLIGRVCDSIVYSDGSVILTEIPEMFGAEQVMYNRCEKEETYKKAEKLIEDFKDYYRKHNQVVYENPSPGNKKGGISTLEDKSLGCVQKGGMAPISNIINYGDIVERKGLTLLEGPGNDIVSSTAMAAAGAHIILFSTGRGTPLGGPVPTIKISTNKDLYIRKNMWIDFDASKVIEEGFEETTEKLLDFIVSIASGEKTKNELNGYSSISIFKSGVTL